MDSEQNISPQQQSEPQINTPKIPEKKANKLPLLLGIFLIVIAASAGTYFLINNKKHQTPQNQTVSPSPTLILQATTPPSMTVPQDWIIKTSEACNLQIPVPPKKPPYYTSSQVTPPTGDAGKYWQFMESKAPADRPTDKEYTDMVYVVMRADDEMGSGYVAGNVHIQCGANTQKHTNEDLLTLYKKPFTNGSNHGLVIKKTETVPLWGKQTIAVSMEGGMYDEGLTVYLLATDSHIYLISKVAMSTDPLIKQTTEDIFTNIQLK